MSQIRLYIRLLLLLIVVNACTQIKQTDKTRILFIGNSYTYYNSTPELVKALVQEKFPEHTIETKLISQGGMTLARHWEEKTAVDAINSGDWDYVVLQEQSKLGMAVMIDNTIYFGQTEQFFEYARKFNTAIKKAGAKTVFLMTWSERSKPEEQKILTHAYATIAKELDAIVAPVGLVWDKIRTNKEINLYANDGSHPSPMGSYLSSITLYATLFASNPVGLSGTISGTRLSSRGEPVSDQQVLVDISKEDAQSIQEASWKVVEAMQNSSDFLDVKRPEPNYKIPVVAKGEAIDLESISGKWYGTSTYGFNYLGQGMEIENVNGKPQVTLSFYSPHVQDRMVVKNALIQENQLTLTIYDSLRTRNSTIRIVLNNDKMSGVLESKGRFPMYKHLDFSRKSIHNDIDISKVEKLLKSFEANTLNIGYVKAAIDHYEQYSKLTGETYTPEEAYLNAVGYNFLRDNKVEEALNHFELAMIYYPQSVNVYDSYAEGLIKAERKEEALEIYTKAYELAKKTNYKDLAYFEENLNKLKNNISVQLEGERMPPPPPPSQ